VPANPPSPSDRNQRPPRPDFAAAAAKLGVTKAQLKDALGMPANPLSPSDRNERPPGCEPSLRFQKVWSVGCGNPRIKTRD